MACPTADRARSARRPATAIASGSQTRVASSRTAGGRARRRASVVGRCARDRADFVGAAAIVVPARSAVDLPRWRTNLCDSPDADHPPLAAARRGRRRRRCWPPAACPPGPGRSRRGRGHCAGPTALPFPHLPAGHAEHAPDRAHRGADDGEPLVRQPARDGSLPGRRAAPAVDGLTGAGADARRTSTRDTERQRRCSPTHADLALPAHRATPEPGLERQPPVLGQRPQRRLRQGQRADRDALLGQARPAVHLLAGQALPDRPAVLLLGARARPIPTAASCSPARVGDDRHQQRSTSRSPAANGTIWDRLDAHNIDWGDLLPERSRATG